LALAPRQPCVRRGNRRYLLGPDKTETQRLFVFGPNTFGGTNSNDFNISVIDDPASYAALLAPVDPATIGFLINAGYEQGRVLFLFISRIHVFSKGRSDDFSQDFLAPSHGEYVFNESYTQFFRALAEYVDQGLSVKIDPTFVPGSNAKAHERICFDARLVGPEWEPRLYKDNTLIKNACYDTPEKKQHENKSIEIPEVTMKEPTKTNVRRPDTFVVQLDPTSTTAQNGPQENTYQFKDQNNFT
jgi:hypothetical protein